MTGQALTRRSRWLRFAGWTLGLLSVAAVGGLIINAAAQARRAAQASATQ